MGRFSTPRIEPVGNTIEEEFNALVTWMNRDVGNSSRNKDMIEHPAFRKIVEYGKDIIPLISKRELKWFEFAVIGRVLGHPEVPEKYWGMLLKMRPYYKAVLKKHGYLKPWYLRIFGP